MPPQKKSFLPFHSLRPQSGFVGSTLTVIVGSRRGHSLREPPADTVGLHLPKPRLANSLGRGQAAGLH